MNKMFISGSAYILLFRLYIYKLMNVRFGNILPKPLNLFMSKVVFQKTQGNGLILAIVCFLKL